VKKAAEKPRPKKKTPRIALRLPKAMRQRLEKECARQEASITTVVLAALDQHLPP